MGVKTLLTILFVLLHLVCGSPTDGAEKAVTKIRVGYVAPTTDNVLIAIAQKKDFFRKRGIEAELISLRDSIDFYGAHEQETIEITDRFTGIRDRESLKAGYDFHKKLFLQPPYPNREGCQTVIEVIGAKTPSGEKISPDLFFDGTLLDEFNEK